MSFKAEDIRHQIGCALIKDRFYLERQLRKVQQLYSQGKPHSRILERFQQVLAKSIDQSSKRQARLPSVIDLPDTLPVAQQAEAIETLLSKHQVVVIAGETGSGKTTQLPKMCLGLGLAHFGMIAHTQPRRLAARSVAARIAEELRVTLGDQVGYQIRFTDQSHELTLVKLMTDGVLLAEIQQDPYLTRYQTIIIDEAHERSLNIDFLLGYLKSLLPKRPDLKVIITSATIDVERFSKHFNGAPVLEVSGRTYPVEVLYRPLIDPDQPDLEKDLQQGILDALVEIEQIDRKAGSIGDVLVFLPGERDIRETAEALRKASLASTQILPLYARLSALDQNKIFAAHSGRRVVLATNVAETSLTVPGIKYVIDTGVARISRYSYRSKVQRLPIEPISQASANQRKGRCGRVQAGICIRLYSEEDFLQRSEFTDPEVVRTNLASVILRMLTLRIGALEDFPFVNPPDKRFIKDGFNLLNELGAIDAKQQLTAIGNQLSRLPIDPRLGRVLLEGARLNCLAEMLVIVSMLAVQDPREWPHDRQPFAQQKHAQWKDEQSDFVEILTLWRGLEEQRQALSGNQFKKYCKDNLISYLRFKEWRDTHRQLHLLCQELDFNENTQAATYESLHTALLAGFLSHIGQKTDDQYYLGARNKRFMIFPGSNQFKRKPKWCLAAELVETSRLYGRMVASIQPQWIEPQAQHLVKRQYFEPHWEKKRGQVVAFEQVTLFGLIIVPKRRVGYEQIDQKVARDIFIREALVGASIQTKGSFLAANQALKESLEALEDKSRRRDIVVDDETLFAFYDQRIAEDIASTATFERWRSRIEQQEPKRLWLTEEELMRQGAARVTENQFPSTLTVDKIHLALSYRFEPGHVEDGVSVEVPSGLLNRLSAGRLEWLVPGMIQDKCVDMLKSLPKSLRKTLVPVPDFVTAFLNETPHGVGDLLDKLIEYAWKTKRVQIQREDFAFAQLDPHFRFNIQVMDDQQRILDQGRDLEQLRERFKDAEQEQSTTQFDSDWEREGLTAWDFDELPEQVHIQQGGVAFDVFPAIIDQRTSVHLTLVDHPVRAQAESQRGLIRLAQLSLDTQVKFWKNSIEKRLGKQSILYSNLGSKQELIQGILDAAVGALLEQKLMREEQVLIRDRHHFESWLEQIKENVWEQVEQILSLVEQSLNKKIDVQKQLKQRMSMTFAFAFSDIKAHLYRLFHKGFPVGLSVAELEQYPRYLQAMLVRIEKLQGNVQKDRLGMQMLDPLEKAFDLLCSQLPLPLYCYPELNEYRQWLEEFRVSLFAQNLGTKISVSEKRLKKRWSEIQESVRVS
jgi:ATP-dependent helicase HrpA